MKTNAEIIQALPPATIQAIADVSGGDGHSIFKPSAYADAGLPPELVKRFTVKRVSDGTPKGTIFSEDKVLPELAGIYGLHVLESICNALDLEGWQHFMGRGFRARACHDAITKHLKILAT